MKFNAPFLTFFNAHEDNLKPVWMRYHSAFFEPFSAIMHTYIEGSQKQFFILRMMSKDHLTCIEIIRLWVAWHEVVAMAIIVSCWYEFYLVGS